MNERELVIHGIYRHYKGGLYLVEGVATHSEDLSDYVVYRPLYGDSSDLWIRPKDMFMDKYNGKDYRFTYLKNGIEKTKPN